MYLSLRPADLSASKSRLSRLSKTNGAPPAWSHPDCHRIRYDVTARTCHSDRCGVTALTPVKAERPCTWCKRQIGPNMRADAKFCSKRCRQSSHRFAVAPAGVSVAARGATADSHTAFRPRRFAYADPPYPGLSGYYPEQREVPHGPLIRRLQLEYPDGWALSTSAESLLNVWCFCPEARLFIWVKKPRGHLKSRVLSSFEALLVFLGHERRLAVSQDLRDVLIARGRHRSFPGALIGMKPPAFCEWMFRLLGVRPGDQLDDLFPGSGAVTEAFRRFTDPGGTAMKSVDAVDPSPEASGDGSLCRQTRRIRERRK